MMVRLRDVERRFIASNGWRSHFYRKEGQWMWRHPQVSGRFNRSEAFNIELSEADRGTRKVLRSRINQAV